MDRVSWDHLENSALGIFDQTYVNQLPPRAAESRVALPLVNAEGVPSAQYLARSSGRGAESQEFSCVLKRA